MPVRDRYPTIADAKGLATQYRRRAVIVLSFAADGFAAASYGMTRKDCSAAKDVVDEICALLSDGTIEVPDALRGEFAGSSLGYGAGTPEQVEELKRLRQEVAQLKALVSSLRGQGTTAPAEAPA